MLDLDDSGAIEEPEFGGLGDDIGDAGFWASRRPMNGKRGRAVPLSASAPTASPASARGLSAALHTRPRLTYVKAAASLTPEGLRAAHHLCGARWRGGP